MNEFKINEKMYNFMKVYNFHKTCFYGELKDFKIEKLNELLDDFSETLIYCISVGCRRNLKFAKYCFNEIKSQTIRYNEYFATSLSASYIKNGEYEKELYTTVFNYGFAPIISRSNLEKLIEYKDLHNILGYYTTLYGYKDLYMKLDITDKLDIDKLIRLYNCENYSNDETKFSYLTDTLYGLFNRIYNYHSMDIRIFSEPLSYDSIIAYNKNPDPSLDLLGLSNIESIEEEILCNYIYDNKIEEIDENIEINTKSILEDVRIAIYAFENEKEKYLNASLSKFIGISPLAAKELIEKYKPFIIFNNNPIKLSSIGTYSGIDKLYIYSILYNNLMTHTCTPIYLENNLKDFVEYSLVEACLYSANSSSLKRILNLYKKSGKCYKLLDFENEKFLENNYENIELNEEELWKKIKINMNKFKNEIY